MIRAIDSRLIAAHQWLVDLTQRAPAWLARQCCLLGFVAVAIRYAIMGHALWAAAVTMIAFAGIAAITLSPGWFHSMGRDLWLRSIFLAVLAIDVALLLLALLLPVPHETVARFTLGCLPDLCLVAFHYFAACQPPRPRAPRPRGRLVHGGAL